MASATGIPQTNPSSMDRIGEDEPLLGRAGDASQQQGKPLPWNLVLGTGTVAQAGIWILTAIVWSAIFSHDLILFSAHPLLNSAGILLLTQGILILQPTHTAQQKRHGTYVHFGFNQLGVIALIAGLIVIEINKARGGLDHFESTHAVLGIITYVLIIIQAIVGFTQYFTPGLWGSVDSAKKIYKYHRMSGYLVLVLALATVAAATQTGYNLFVLHIQLWAVLVAAILTLIGVFPRIKKQKLGLS
ncbi:eukaryotic cytochrome b561-domain-containing protein [Phyllosticta capitalensis]|uniref:Eukaryotic cytochrome b561-domain-containing protein n=1 Tax=Phyllosticta capitalensis TaxID=121624 RepID=A0ABR1YEG4_9PEZI